MPIVEPDEPRGWPKASIATDEEMESNPHVIVTPDAPWDPHGLIMPGGLDEDGYPTVDCFVQRIISDESHGINCHHHMYEIDSASFSIDGNTEQLLLERMISSINVEMPRNLGKLQSHTRHSQFDPAHVAAIFNVGIGTAKDIL